LPEAIYAQGIRRHGLHDLSYEFIAIPLPRSAPSIASERFVALHLGSGASAFALVDGRSADSTMGFTALDGLPVGNRPGQLDPGVVRYLIERGMSP
jgi:acetate kinase